VPDSSTTSPDQAGAGFPGPLTRRTVLLGTGAAIAAAPFAGGGEADAKLLPDKDIYGPGVDVLSAVVGRVFGPRTMYAIARLPGSKKLFAIPVGLIPAAVVQTEHGSDLKTFLPGDEILLGGRWEPGGFAAAVIEQTYRLRHGRILKRHENRLVLDDGVVRIMKDTRTEGDGAHEDGDKYEYRAVPLRKLRAGDVIWAMGRREGPTGDILAATISTRRRSH
jgi:hypothetical protein